MPLGFTELDLHDPYLKYWLLIAFLLLTFLLLNWINNSTLGLAFRAFDPDHDDRILSTDVADPEIGRFGTGLRSIGDVRLSPGSSSGA